MTRRWLVACLAALIWCLVPGWHPAARAQGTAFNFQGRLTDGGGPANGYYDFQFSLRDSLAAGSAIGTPVVIHPLGVTNGLFSVALDFGSAAFDGSARWLEVGARTNGSAAAYAILSPRTPLHAVPYAVYATPPAAVSALAAQVAALAAQVAALSNQASAPLPPGVPVVSDSAQDPAYLAQGLQLFQTVPAPAWVGGASSGAPSGRIAHTAVWSGQQWLVWGGDVGGGTFSGGGAGYAPASDSWQSIASYQAPSARAGHAAVWSGTELLVWGGFGSSGYPVAGGRYDVVRQTWSLPATNGAPSGRDGHVAVWTGSRMLVWGGRNNMGLLADGGAYDPVGDQWSPLPLSGSPEGRRYATAIWTGTNMVVWGGQGLNGELGTGGRLVCNTAGVPQSWQTTSVAGAPSPRLGHTAVWTGTKMFVWGGLQDTTYLGDGAAYDPVADAWTPMNPTNAPAPRAWHVAAWTGSELLIFGGEDLTGSLLTGAAYDPVKNRWRSLDTAAGAVARSKATALWTGTELLLYGGLSAGSPIALTQRLRPQPAWYFYRQP